MGLESFDDWILMQEELLGQNLAVIDDHAVQEQNRSIERSRAFIPD